MASSPDDVDEAESPSQPSDQELRRLVLRVIACALALVVAGAVATAASRLGGGDDGRADGDEAAAAAAADGTIGPLPGRPLAAYAKGRASALASARGQRTAVVSFASYLDEAAARQRVAGERVTVSLLLVAPPGGTPAELAANEDVGAFVRRQREEATAEKRALEELVPTVEDPDFARQYTDDAARLGLLLAGLDSNALVYGAVVTGPAGSLRAIAAAPEVRLVDVGDDDGPVPQGGARGIRPEETVRAGDPPDRPAAQE